MTSSRTRRNKKAICDMIMFILTIIYVAFFYYVFYNPDKNNTLSTFTHERPLALYQSLNPMAVFFGSEYQSNKEYMTFLPVLIKLKSRENNNLIVTFSLTSMVTLPENCQRTYKKLMESR